MAFHNVSIRFTFDACDTKFDDMSNLSDTSYLNINCSDLVSTMSQILADLVNRVSSVVKKGQQKQNLSKQYLQVFQRNLQVDS